MMHGLPEGVRLYSGYFDHAAQEKLVDAIRACLSLAPLFRPTMPRTGKPLSVRMSNCGLLGWVSDRDGGYRYQAAHPVTGKPWPAMPPELHALWTNVSDYPHPPEACLINFYNDIAKMSLHQDRDEATFEAPVVSVSLGDTCRFRLGDTMRRGGKTIAFDLMSGDVLVLGGAGRLCFHGVDRIIAGSSMLLTAGGRINLTLRRVSAPPPIDKARTS